MIRAGSWMRIAAAPCAAVVLALAGEEHLRPDFVSLTRNEQSGLQTLVDQLGHPDPLVRNLAIRRLNSVGAAVVDPLTLLLRKGSDPKRVSMACLALGTIPSSRGFAVLQQYFMDGARHPDVLRAVLVAFALSDKDLRDEVLRKVADLALGAATIEVQQIAWLSLGARRLPGFARLVEQPLSKARNSVLRAAMVLALAESGDGNAPLVLEEEMRRFRTEDPVNRSCLLYAVSRMEAGEALRDFAQLKVRDEEMPGLLLALATDSPESGVARLAELLVSKRDAAALAVFSLARAGSSEADALLLRALQGEFGDKVCSLAALAVSVRESQELVQPLKQALSHPSPEVRTNAALTLAWWRTGPAQEEWYSLLERESEPSVLPALVLGLCQSPTTPDRRPKIADADLARDPALSLLLDQVDRVIRGRTDPRILREQVADRLHQKRAHWLLRRAELLDRLLIRVLDLDRIQFHAGESDSGGIPRFDPGSDDEPSGDGGEDPQSPPEGDSRDLFQRGRRNKNDFARFEADLRLFLRDFPMFAPTSPFLR